MPTFRRLLCAALATLSLLTGLAVQLYDRRAPKSLVEKVRALNGADGQVKTILLGTP